MKRQSKRMTALLVLVAVILSCVIFGGISIMASAGGMLGSQQTGSVNVFVCKGGRLVDNRENVETGAIWVKYSTLTRQYVCPAGYTPIYGATTTEKFPISIVFVKQAKRPRGNAESFGIYSVRVPGPGSIVVDGFIKDNTGYWATISTVPTYVDCRHMFIFGQYAPDNYLDKDTCEIRPANNEQRRGQPVKLCNKMPTPTPIRR